MKKCLYCNMEVENINKESICCECESKIALYKKKKEKSI